jgi:NTP pyrophosphatase (non-canonical NTP hydrolase)
MEICEAQKLAKRLAEEFDEKYRKVKRKTTAQLYFIDMIETLGELAGTLKVKELWHTTPEFYRIRPKGKLENELVDFLYDILMISNIYGVNLEKAFVNRMKQFHKSFLQNKTH